MKKEKLKTVLLVAVNRFMGASLGSTSVIITYYLLLSLFPMIIAVGNVLPLFGIHAGSITGYLDILIPEPLLSFLLPIIDSLLGSASGVLLSFSLITTIWSAGRGVSFLQKGMNKAYGISDRSSYLARRLLSMVTIILILLLLVGFALVYSFGVALLQVLAPDVAGAQGVLDALAYAKWPVMIVFIFLMLLFVYRITPDVKLHLRQVWPGALLATAGLLLFAQLFTLYLSYVARSFSSYGALGAFFLLMIWVNFSVRIVLVGTVLNATISEYYHGPAQEVRSRVDNAIDKLVARVKGWLAHKGKALPAIPGQPLPQSPPPEEAAPQGEAPPPDDAPPNDE